MRTVSKINTAVPAGPIPGMGRATLPKLMSTKLPLLLAFGSLAPDTIVLKLTRNVPVASGAATTPKVQERDTPDGMFPGGVTCTMT